MSNETAGDQKYISTGRGGFGNVERQPQDVEYQRGDDFPPPNIGQNIERNAAYSTGRGGAGNMMHNEDPNKTRLAQDVDPSTRDRSASPHMVEAPAGRGGVGNLENYKKETARPSGERADIGQPADTHDVKTEKGGQRRGSGLGDKLKEVKEKLFHHK